MLISLTIVIISQYIRISKYGVHLKYVQFLLASYTSAVSRIHVPGTLADLSLMNRSQGQSRRGLLAFLEWGQESYPGWSGLSASSEELDF